MNDHDWKVSYVGSVLLFWIGVVGYVSCWMIPLLLAILVLSATFGHIFAPGEQNKIRHFTLHIQSYQAPPWLVVAFS